MKPKTKVKALSIRATEAQAINWLAAAKADDRSFSNWATRILDAAAKAEKP